MMFKNTVKLISANFSTVWKLLLYSIIIALLTVGLCAPFMKPVMEAFRTTDFLTEFEKFFDTFSIGSNILGVFASFFAVMNIMIQSIITLASINIGALVYFAILFLFVVPFLFGLAELAVGDTIYGYMSSQAKIGFGGAFFRNLRKSLAFQFWKTLAVLPCNVIILVCLYYSLSLATLAGPIRYAVPVIVTIVAVISVSLKMTLFSGWMPALVALDCGVLRAGQKGSQAVARRFWRVFSTLLMTVLVFYLLNILFGFVAFVVIIPLGHYLTLVFQNVMFFTSQGMRYYVDSDTIVTPKKLEEVDKFGKIKDLI